MSALNSPLYRVTWLHPAYCDHSHTVETDDREHARYVFDDIVETPGTLWATFDVHMVYRLRTEGTPA